MKQFHYQDHYFHEAKKKGYVARSAFKLEEIQAKFGILTKNTKAVLDIGCAPGSWMQYTHEWLVKNKVPAQILGCDLKPSKIQLPDVSTYQQDVLETENMEKLFQEHQISQFDVILSDLAPDTIGHASTDALRSVAILEKILPLYERWLKPDGSRVTKIFMGPGFEEYVANAKKIFGPKTIFVFKPKACRKDSKETYVVRKVKQ